MPNVPSVEETKTPQPASPETNCRDPFFRLLWFLLESGRDDLSQAPPLAAFLSDQEAACEGASIVFSPEVV